MPKYVAEFIGTFFLVLTLGLTAISGSAFVPVAVVATLVGMIYAGGHISRAHYNPAITFAFLIRGRMLAADVVPYLIAQFAGASLASLAAIFLLGKSGTPTPIAAAIPQAILAEFLFTFALAWVILNVATAKASAGNSHYGLGIGAIVLGGAYAVGGLTGAAFNPAVAFGAALMKLLPFHQIWIHLVGSLLGAVAAALTYNAVVKDAD